MDPLPPARGERADQLPPSWASLYVCVVPADRRSPNDKAERRALGIALALNASLFALEFTTGLLAQSLGLIADSLDMLADAVVYALSLAAVGTVASRQQQLARASGVAQIGLAAFGLFEVLRRALNASPLPDPRTMVVISLIALVANLATLAVLRKQRTGGLHLQASWIFTANDTRANLLVIAAAVLVAATDSSWPDLLAGALIFVVVARGGLKILRLTRTTSEAPDESR